MVGRGTRGPQGFLQLLPLLGTFFVPCLGLHSGAEARGRGSLLLHSRAVHARPPVGPGCHQTGLGAASVTQVLPVGPGCHQGDLTAASVTWVPLVSPGCCQGDLSASSVTQVLLV